VCVLAALEDMEAGLGLTNHLEELRKEGGDRWLSILNAPKVLTCLHIRHMLPACVTSFQRNGETP